LGAIESFGSKFFSGILASVIFIVCCLANCLISNSNLEEVKTRTCLLVLHYDFMCMCVSHRFFFFPTSIKLAAQMLGIVLWFHAKAKPSELEP
jgi:hypothetical protein